MNLISLINTQNGYEIIAVKDIYITGQNSPKYSLCLIDSHNRAWRSTTEAASKDMLLSYIFTAIEYNKLDFTKDRRLPTVFTRDVREDGIEASIQSFVQG